VPDRPEDVLDLVRRELQVLIDIRADRTLTDAEQRRYDELLVVEEELLLGLG